MSFDQLGPRVDALHAHYAEVSGRIDAATEAGYASEDAAYVSEMLAALALAVEELRALHAEDVALSMQLGDMAATVADLQTKVGLGIEMDTESVMATIAEFEAWLGATVEAAPAVTLSARRPRGRRADEAVEPDPAASADVTSEAGEAAFDPMMYETVEEVDIAIGEYDAAIATLQADIAAYEEAIAQLEARREELGGMADVPVVDQAA